MSYAQFLGQTTPFYSTESLTLGNQNWITYLTTPNLSTNIPIVSGGGETSLIFTTPNIPAGYWNFVWTWELQAQNKESILSYELSISNNLTPPSAVPIWGTPNPIDNIQYFQSNTTTAVIAMDTISGLIWSDGTDNSKIKLHVSATSSGGSDILFMNWNNATSYPCLSLFKIG